MKKINIIIVVLMAFVIAISVVGVPSASISSVNAGQGATHTPRDHKGTPDPCKDSGNCGPGDHGQGNPTKAVPNCNAMQGEPDVCKTKAPKATDVPRATATHVPQATATSVPQSTPTDTPRATATATPNDTPPAATGTPRWNPTATPQRHAPPATPQTYVTPVVTPFLTPYQYVPSTGCPALKCGCLATIVVTETMTTWSSGITQTIKVTTYTYQSSSGLTR